MVSVSMFMRSGFYGIVAALSMAAIAPAFAADAAMVLAYKRDPVAIYDDTGSKLRELPQKQLPKANTPDARVIGSKTGFVAIMINGEPSWLRLTSVDYVGDLPAPKCDAGSAQLALREEDGVERSLGLGCSKPK